MMKYNIDRIFGSVITKTVEDKNRHIKALEEYAIQLEEEITALKFRLTENEAKYCDFVRDCSNKLTDVTKKYPMSSKWNALIALLNAYNNFATIAEAAVNPNHEYIADLMEAKMEIKRLDNILYRKLEQKYV